MNLDLLFTGDIRMVTKSLLQNYEFDSSNQFIEDELYKKDATLVKVYDEDNVKGYVDVDDIKGPLDWIKAYGFIQDGITLGGIVMTVNSNCEVGGLFIDRNTIRTYNFDGVDLEALKKEEPIKLHL